MAAVASAACIVPMRFPGGKPMTEDAGDTPKSPVTTVGPVLLTSGVAPSTAKLVAVPSEGAVAANVVGAERKVSNAALVATPKLRR